MRTQEEIDEQLNRAAKQADKGGSRYHGMTYEQGVDAALRWLDPDTFGEDVEAPLGAEYDEDGD